MNTTIISKLLRTMIMYVEVCMCDKYRWFVQLYQQ